jgi:hypothetical protein
VHIQPKREYLLRGFFTPWEKAHAGAAANADRDINRLD